MIGAPAAVVPLTPLKNPHFEASKAIGMITLARRSPLGVAAVILSGITWAGVMATGPVFAQRMGLTDFDKSLFMALPIIGGVTAQFPLGWLADHHERRLVLSGMSVGAALFAAAGVVASGPGLLIAITGFGAMTFPLYAVAVALTNEVLSQDHRIAASASVVVYFGIGAVAGPSVIALTMDSFGPVGFFLSQSLAEAIFGAAVLLSLIQMRRRSA
jgi:MFS family permease